MPGKDKTGPSGLGALTGRGMGNCSDYAPDDISVIILRFIFANWKTILGFIMAIALPVISRRFFMLNPVTSKILQLSSSQIKGSQDNGN